ncbi:MAG: mechanosensitive ion channel family protein [Planctomycetota bacterium]
MLENEWVPLVLVVIVVVGVLRIADLLLLRRGELSLEKRLPRQITMLILTVAGLIAVVLSLPGGQSGPVSDSTRGDLLSLIGLSVTALLTLSSTTLAANAMAGLMLRATAPFRGGDWIRVGDHFGRVTERGLFHTEVQTEDRDLMTLPNLFLATNPVRIVDPGGTIVSADVSLGYAVPHGRVEPLLMAAAEAAGLCDPFVWITELRDHTVVYRAAGRLEDVKGLISARSRLRSEILDHLHAAGVEVASPSLMIQRRATLDDNEIPSLRVAGSATSRDNEPVEARVFDKAESAAERAELEAERDRLRSLLEGKSGEADGSGDDAADDRATLRAAYDAICARLEAIDPESER